MADPVYTAEMGQPPMDPEGVPSTKRKPEAKKPEPKKSAPKGNETTYDLSSRVSLNDLLEKKAKGGYVKAADGIASRGKTRGTMVMCGGGMAKRK